jgi:hypothetical protein
MIASTCAATSAPAASEVVMRSAGSSAGNVLSGVVVRRRVGLLSVCRNASYVSGRSIAKQRAVPSSLATIPRSRSGARISAMRSSFTSAKIAFSQRRSRSVFANAAIAGAS